MQSARLQLFAALFLLLAAGCSSVRPLVDTPNIYGGGRAYPEAEIPDELKSPFADILYVSDRQPTETKKGRFDYGAGRSRSMAFGAVTVEIGKSVTWPMLVAASENPEREKKIPLTVKSVTEIARYPETPLPFSIVDGKPQVDPAVEVRYDETAASLRDEIRSRLSAVKTSEAVLFIHGFNTPFDEAAFIMTEIWHFAGRRGLPIVYSWPSGSGGPFGKFTDRESGEFTIYHLKEFLRLLAGTPELERIQIITHSRGSDVVTSALRELVIESRAAGRDPKQEFRIDNLIMAAPDLDFGVVEQRLVAEKFGAAVGRITIYTSEKDGALRLSQVVMKGTRFGRVRAEDLSDADAQIFENVKNVNFISVEDPSGFVAHSYFRKDPAVLSDIIALIRDGAAPADVARPLQLMQRNFWRLSKDYMVRH
jgi:esterase/lipase superfamily enzyme